MKKKKKGGGGARYIAVMVLDVGALVYLLVHSEKRLPWKKKSVSFVPSLL